MDGEAVDVVVVGVVGRDLVVSVEELPQPGGRGPVRARLEGLGGALNQAVACVQLGLTAAAVGVVGDDDAGRVVLDEARRDGLDVTGVVARSGTATALMVDIVEGGGVRRVLEDVPDAVLLTAADVRGAAPVFRGSRAVLVQAAQPPAAVAEAVRLAARAGALVLLDGAVTDEEVRREVLPTADVVRADAAEAPDLAGREVPDVPAALEVAGELLAAGPGLVALAVGSEGNVLAWPGGHVVLPLLGGEPVDPTGGGDAFVAGLVAALLGGADPESAGWAASAAAALTVAHLGGRPELDPAQVDGLARESRRER